MASPDISGKGAGQQQKDSVAARLLAWYDAHHRELPWRVSPAAARAGERKPTPTASGSPVMLQQTTVER